jgi:hypothetical protein
VRCAYASPMPAVTVLTEEGTSVVEGVWSGDHLMVHRSEIPTAIGWELKPQGLCRGDMCVPLVNIDEVERGGGYDLNAIAGLLHRPTLGDPAADILVVGVPSTERQRAVVNNSLPPLFLPDLAGGLHCLDSWKGKKKLLIAFSSW